MGGVSTGRVRVKGRIRVSNGESSGWVFSFQIRVGVGCFPLVPFHRTLIYLLSTSVLLSLG